MKKFFILCIAVSLATLITACKNKPAESQLSPDDVTNIETTSATEAFPNLEEDLGSFGDESNSDTEEQNTEEAPEETTEVTEDVTKEETTEDDSAESAPVGNGSNSYLGSAGEEEDL